ncbi:MAG: ABC transporter permease [Methylorubrum populi]
MSPSVSAPALALARLTAAGGRAIPLVAGLVLAAVLLAAILAPWLAPHDPVAMMPTNRLKPPGGAFPLGTDAYGRDLLSRILYGARTSLLIGLGSAAAALALGLPLGLLAGSFRWLEAALMRVMDGLMAVPGILLAIAVVALAGSSIGTVLVAITIPEVPRVVRLVRSVVLTARGAHYVEAAATLGSSPLAIMWRHLMPSTVAPLIIQGTYIAASAILTEATLSFLGAGIGTETPSWGNIMSEGRLYFLIKPALIFWPGLILSLCILSINILGDELRDLLDPHQKTRKA